MDKKQQQAIISKLEKAGIKGVRLELTSGLGVKVSTDYAGPYPGKEQFEILNKCRQMFGKSYKVEDRGHYTAVFIY